MRRFRSTFLLSSALAAAGCSGGVGTGADNPALGPGNAGTASALPPGGTMTGSGGDGSALPGVIPGVTPGVTMNTAGSGPAAGGAGSIDTPPPVAATTCAPGVPATSQINRISAFEYENIIADVFGVDNASVTLATDQVGVITKPTWDAYVNTAKGTAVDVMSNPTAKAVLIPCAATQAEDACLASIVTDIGRKLFRRPLTTEEITGYQEKLISQRAAITATGSLDETAELILNTMLQSPSFLQHAETEGVAGADGSYSLSQFEVAARLSFMLWGSVPDQTLNDAADAGELATQAQILAQAQRMLQHENARRVVSTFHQSYMHLTSSGRWIATAKDPVLYPVFPPDVVGDMIYEELALFDSVFTSGGSFQDLMLTNKAWVTPFTAPLYGLTGEYPAGEYTEVDLDGTRPGFLTRVGFLAAFSNPERTNPIVRGAYIVKDVIGIEIGAPDPAAAMTPLPADPGLVTVRDKVADMTKAGNCAGCHTPFVNPPGFVLEGFDTAGQVQTAEAASGGTVNTVADIVFDEAIGPETVNDAAEMMAKIATSPLAQRTYAKKLVGFAFGRTLTGPDVCAVDALTLNMGTGPYAIRNLIADLTQQNYFTTRATEVTQ